MNRKMKVAIFCKVVDNFGDAGFCARLAMSLASKAEVVSIYCDDLDLIKKICLLTSAILIFLLPEAYQLKMEQQH